MVESSKLKVVITGISGFLGSQTCLKFLQDGTFQIRGTVRDSKNEKKLAPLRTAFGPLFDNLELFNADLLKPESLDAAIAGMDYVVHTASPCPLESPKDENELIKPAVEGTIAVMRAAHKHKVKRVVMTSSISAVSEQKPENHKESYDEGDWSDLQVCPPYEKSKTLAEKAAWEFLKSLPEDERFELVTINPVLILGPSLVAADFSSGQIIGAIMGGKYPGMPKIMLSIVDVRDVALAHFQALKVKEAANKRFILSDRGLWFLEIANILHTIYPEYRIAQSELGYCPIKVISWFDKKAARVLPKWGKNEVINSTRSREILGIEYITAEEAILEITKSLINNGVIPDKRVNK
ncbi:hypothetical protein FGO68_gene2508 [Halteria grandinella]|uniref:NAD-dependent epimerase/dehydratase domain-containing protein n=1 Tax=Halteria grandinella TaxID=5974 RepID=A0A8J8NM09_HALGN|nr:hypothetical protein FGO68_gene2508 [Halteria grandinella]